MVYNNDFVARFEETWENPNGPFAQSVGDTFEKVYHAVEAFAKEKGAEVRPTTLYGDRRNFAYTSLEWKTEAITRRINICPSMNDEDLSVSLWPSAERYGPVNKVLGHATTVYDMGGRHIGFYHVSPDPEKVRNALERAYQAANSIKRKDLVVSHQLR